MKFNKYESKISKAGKNTAAAVQLFDETIATLKATNLELATLHSEITSDIATLDNQRYTIEERIAHNESVIKNIESIVAVH